MRKQSLKAVNHIIVSSAEPIGPFNAGFDTVNLHRTTEVRKCSDRGGIAPTTAASPAHEGLLEHMLHQRMSVELETLLISDMCPCPT